jgi:Domain of unknown function (DUF3459)
MLDGSSSFINRIGGHAGTRVLGQSAVLVKWRVDHNLQLTLKANLSGQTLEGVPGVGGHTIWEQGPVPDDSTIGPWSLRWSLQEEGQCQGPCRFAGSLATSHRDKYFAKRQFFSEPPATWRSLVTLNIPGTELARIPATSLSI